MGNYKKYHSKNNIIILIESCAVSPWLSCLEICQNIPGFSRSNFHDDINDSMSKSIEIQILVT